MGSWNNTIPQKNKHDNLQYHKNWNNDEGEFQLF